MFEHDTPLVEGCNTGFQFHLQIGPKDFTKMYNISKLIAGPVLSVSVTLLCYLQKIVARI